VAKGTEVPDLLLTALMDFVARREKELREQLATHAGAYEEIHSLFPPVTLVLPGGIVSGNLVPYRIYSQHMRQLVKPTEGKEEEAVEIANTFLREFYDYLDYQSEEFESEELLRRQLYLVNVAVLSANRPIEMPPLSVSLEAVQGWTLGQIPT